MNELVSIVMPSYNTGNFISEISSLALNRSYIRRPVVPALPSIKMLVINIF